MDAMLRCLQTASPENQAWRPHPLRMWMGMVILMAKVIEFYVPNRFRKIERWIPVANRGKVIEFYLPAKKSA